MALLGQYNQLVILRSMMPGVFLDGGELGDILLPKKQVPPDAVVGTKIDVFVYRDSEDRPIATTLKPRAVAGEFVSLQVVSVDDRFGAFLDWGLDKDLLLPIREQSRRLRRDDWVLVHVYVDEVSHRIVSSMRLHRFISREPATYREGEQVNLVVIDKNDLGYEVVIENKHRGLLYYTDVRIDLYEGQRLEGFVRKVREDGKIDVALDPAGYSRVAPLSEKIYQAMEKAGGRLPFNDDSSPELIRREFGCSKKAFKQATGSLFKERRLVFLENGIGIPGKL